MTEPKPCPFCAILGAGDFLPQSWLPSGMMKRVHVFRDQYPVSPGHTLIIPVRHVSSIFDLDPDEERAIWVEANRVRVALGLEFNPQGFNVGFNDGKAAGQTVMHAHLHIIPRFEGDTLDPRGGVRHCIPGKGYYTPVEK